MPESGELYPGAANESLVTQAEKTLDDFDPITFEIDDLKQYQKELHKDIALKMIKVGGAGIVAKYIKNFEGLNHSDIALRMIEAGGARAVAEYIQNFEGLNHSDIALRMIKTWVGARAVAYDIKNFEGLNHSDIALRMIEAKQAEAVAYYIKNFEGLNHSDIALRMIEAKQARAVAEYIQNFEGLNHSDIALRMIEAGEARAVAYYIKNFEGLNHSDIALRMIEAGEAGAVAYYIKNFEGLNTQVALKMIEAWDAGEFGEPWDTGETYVDGEAWSIARCIKNFEKLHTQVALKMIEAKQAGAVAKYIKNFEGLNHSDIALRMIEAGGARAVAEYIQNFEGLNHSDIALRMIEAGEARAVAEYIQNFEGLNHSDIALRMIEAGEAGTVAYYIKNFEGLDLELQNPASDLNQKEAANYPVGTTFGEILRLFKTPQIGKKLVLSLVDLTQFSYKQDCLPIMNAQGPAAFLYFESCKKALKISQEQEVVNMLVHIAKKYGAQARNIVVALLTSGTVLNDVGFIDDFVDKGFPIHKTIFDTYKNSQDNPEELEAMKERCLELKNEIYQGSVTEQHQQDPFYNAVMYSTFPPAMGITEGNLTNLNAQRPDRRADVPATLDTLQYRPFSVPTGRYELGEGEELDLEIWNQIGDAVQKVHADLDKKSDKKERKKIDLAQVGARLIKMYQTKENQSPEGRSELFEIMYAYHLHKGNARFPESCDVSLDGLMQYKEFVGDQIKNDLIRDCLDAYVAVHPTEFDALIRDTLNRTKGGNDRAIKSIAGRLHAIQKQRDPEAKEAAIIALDSILKDYGIAYSQIEKMTPDDLERELRAEPIGTVQNDKLDLKDTSYRTQEFYDSDDFTSALDSFEAKRDPVKLTYAKISSDLAGTINREMRKEVDKFKMHGGATQEERALEFVVSKKKEHGVAGYNMGVCVAPDEKLWNDPEFWNGILFDQKSKVAMGGLHLFVRGEDLTLPGINPSLELLATVDNEKLFDAMITYAQEVQQAVGCKRLLIPVNTAIHSNRSQIQEIIRKKGYTKIPLYVEQPFSYSPHKYSFQECFLVE